MQRWQHKHSGSGFTFICALEWGWEGQAASSLQPPPSVLPPASGLACPRPPPRAEQLQLGVNEPESWVAVSFLFPWHLAGVTPEWTVPHVQAGVRVRLCPQEAPAAGTLPLGQGMSATRAVKGAGLMEQMGGLCQPLARTIA